jgi:hypothetical protein
MIQRSRATTTPFRKSAPRRGSTFLLLGALLALGLGGCGGAAIPSEQLTAAQAAVRAAEVGGAPEVPQAALSLKRANDQIVQAKKLIEDGENEQALRVLNKAEIDAELALALAREDSMKKQAAETREQLDKMKKKAAVN